MVQEALEPQRHRLEDFIALAAEGIEVEAELDLERHPVVQKLHPAQTEDMSGEVVMYLLLGNYTLTAEGESRRVSKVYAFGANGESLQRAKVTRIIANERLKMDFKRLAEANIKIEEKYF